MQRLLRQSPLTLGIAQNKTTTAFCQRQLLWLSFASSFSSFSSSSSSSLSLSSSSSKAFLSSTPNSSSTSTNTKISNNTSTTTTKYTFAFSRNVPKSFSNAIVKYAAVAPTSTSKTTSSSSTSSTTNTTVLDWKKSQEQHDIYLKCLRKYVPTICLPALEEYPDCTFVEDTVVAIGKKAVITNPGHVSRKGEVDTIKQLLLQLGMTVIDMRRNNDNGNNNISVDTATCDGGDVLYTGRHLFVGLSERTNRAAVDILANAFAKNNNNDNNDDDNNNIPPSPSSLRVEDVIAVPFQGNALHLKSIVTHIDEYTLLAPTGELGDYVIKEMKAIERGYEIIRLPNMLACNVVSVNGTILAQDAGCDESKQLLQSLADRKGYTIEFLNLSENAKADGALTCCSVLLSI